MSLNSTPSAERTYIGIFGRRNAGKSSLINAITGQSLAIVSDTLGTTTDPVSKAMEILPLGPVVLIDTPGLDDEGTLGSQRVEKAYEVLRKCHIALLVVDINEGMSELEEEFLQELKLRKIPYIICYNKCELKAENNRSELTEIADEIRNSDKTDLKSKADADNIICVSAKENIGITELKERLAKLLPKESEKHLVADLVEPLDTVVLVVPIDESAPKGRLILPQQQTIRDLLEKGAIPVVCRETELKATLDKLKEPPKLVITDSQAFKLVAQIVPEDISLTSFSILMARYKGDFNWQYEGVKTLDTIEDGDKILISEGCTHHRQCGDIGTVKLPAMIKKYTGKEIELTFTSGGEFPEDLGKYKLIIHCGGCTLNEKEMQYRIAAAKAAGVPITNYGMTISYVNGILERSIRIFKSNNEN